MTVPQIPRPDADRIKADIIQLAPALQGITIASADQIEQFTLVGTHQRPEFTEVIYDIAMIVVDSVTQRRYKATLSVAYNDSDYGPGESWRLSSGVQGNLEEILPPLPTPAQQPVPAGQPVQLGPYTIVIYGTQLVDWVDDSGFEYKRTKRLLIDFALRNELAEPLEFSTRNPPYGISFVIQDSKGEPLNKEFDGDMRWAVGLLPSDQQTDMCISKVNEILYHFDNGISPGRTLDPGDVFRGWVGFQQTAGLDQGGVQLGVTVSGRPRVKETYQATFQLGPKPAETVPLEWKGVTSQPADTITVGSFQLSQARIGPVEPQENTFGSCQFQRTVSLHLKNNAAETITLNELGLFYLMDAAGRLYERVDLGEWRFSPKEEGDVTISFPAILGVRDQPTELLVVPRETASTNNRPVVDGRRFFLSIDQQE